MTAAPRLVHFVHSPTRRGRVFRDRRTPLDLYDDLELFQRFPFPRLQLLEVTDELNGDVQYLAARKGSLPASVKCT